MLLLLFNNYPVVVSSTESYLKDRERLIEAERKLRFGHDVDLTSDEMKANECLMRAKTEEIDNELQLSDIPRTFYRRRISNFKKIKLFRVYQILRKMPKGGLFHAHGLSILSIDKVLEYTRLPNLYVCVSGDRLRFRFSRSRPASDDRCRAWASMEEQRRKNPNLDEKLKRKLRLDPATTTSPEVGHVELTTIYEKFMCEALQELHDDNIMFLELRNALIPLYDFEGTTYTREDTVRTLLKVVKCYALIKHSKLMEVVKKKIVVEVSPISNQVLKLVADMRNHPAAHFFAMNLPVVMTSDDQALWGASGLSYDFYEAFVGIMSSEADLRALKQLALNSIKNGSLNEQERTRAFEIFNREWIKFVVELTNSSLCADE
ncbi:hypothetical protein TKK_0014466 [Trichogramma kaykai]